MKRPSKILQLSRIAKVMILERMRGEVDFDLCRHQVSRPMLIEVFQVMNREGLTTETEVEIKILVEGWM